MQAKFYTPATRRAAEREGNSPPSGVNRVHQLEAEIAALRGRETDELRALRSSNRNMAQHIQALSLFVREQEKRIARLQAEPSESGRRATLVALAAPPLR